MNTEQPQPTNEAAGGASDVERVVRALVAVPVKRDEDGYWWHPGLPWDEVPEETDATPYIEAWGFEPAFVSMTYDAQQELVDRYFDSDSPNCSYWHPSKPDGDGWVLAAIYDTEDGPAACWVRSTPELAAVSPEPTFERTRQWKQHRQHKQCRLQKGYATSRSAATRLITAAT